MYHGAKSAVRESFPEEGTPGCGVKNTQGSARWSQGGSSDEALEEDGLHPVEEGVAVCPEHAGREDARGEDARGNHAGPAGRVGGFYFRPRRTQGTTEVLEAEGCRDQSAFGKRDSDSTEEGSGRDKGARGGGV